MIPSKDPFDPKLWEENTNAPQVVYNNAIDQADDIIEYNDDTSRLSEEEINDLNGHSQRTDVIFPKLDKMGLLEKAMELAKQSKDNDVVRNLIRTNLHFLEEMNNDTIDALRNANYPPKKPKPSAVHKVPNSKIKGGK